MAAVMDKSEVEIIAAIKFYFEHKKPGDIIGSVQHEIPQPAMKQLPESPGKEKQG